MALLGGGPRRRLTKRAIRDLDMRVRLTGKAREAPLLQAGGLGKAAIRAGGSLLRRFGKKIPGVRRFVPGSSERIARMERLTAIRGLGGRGAPTRPGLGRAVAPVAKTAVKLVTAGAAIELGSRGLETLLPTPVVTVRPMEALTALGDIFGGGRPMAHPGVARGQELEIGGQAPPGTTIVKVWDTGTARFARDAAGYHYVQKKDGSIKRFRPPRPVVVPKKWDARAMNRVMRRLASHQNAAMKLIKLMGGSASKTRSSRGMTAAQRHHVQ